MSTERRALPDVLGGLILAAGLSHQEAAVRAGVSPGSIVAICERIPKPLMTWLRLITALGGRLSVSWQGQCWDIVMPRIPAALREREWVSWRTRRVVTTINHLHHAEPKTKGRVIDERARAYAENEEVRLRERLVVLQGACTDLVGSLRASGLRATVHLVATRIGLKAEELTLLAGASLSACQLALGEPRDGRLATVHRLCSALGARIGIVWASARIDIAICPPGDWRPGMPVTGVQDDCDEKPPGLVRGVRDNQNRSLLANADMLGLYDQGLSIGEIARKAGISRQRVHKLAMDHGRTRRRQTARTRRIESGREALGII